MAAHCYVATSSTKRSTKAYDGFMEQTQMLRGVKIKFHNLKTNGCGVITKHKLLTVSTHLAAHVETKQGCHAL
jgi:hypothetical protein